MTSRIVLLNGVGSAGKSSIARALQATTAEPFLHVAMDEFLDMLPEGYENHPDALVFEPVETDGPPEIAIRSGPVVERLLTGMRAAVATLARTVNNLIVDDVMLGDELEDYRRRLDDFALHTVAVRAPLDVLEARERARGDRMIGLARWQFDRVHRGKAYDLEINTADTSPEACAHRIRDAFGL